MSEDKPKILFKAQPETMVSAKCPICGQIEWLVPTPGGPEDVDKIKHLLLTSEEEDQDQEDKSLKFLVVLMAACANCGFVRYHLGPQEREETEE